MLAALVVGAVLTAVAGCGSPAGSPPPAASPIVAEASKQATRERLPSDAGDAPARRQDDPHGALGVADGEVPEGVTVFEHEYPAVARLSPALLGALHRAAEDAGGDGVDLYVNSGWRSPAYQRQLLDEAISEYGSSAEAARWVATPATSPHVSGDAVDIGRADAATWLSKHGGEYGLCQIYRNEPWHYELRLAAVAHGCPPMYPDPTRDPRMRQ